MQAMAIGAVLLGLLGCGDKRAREHGLAAQARACAHDELSCPVPIFTVRDLRAAQRYYRDALGFTIEWEYGDPPDFGAVKRGGTVLFMCQGCQGAPGAWLMTFTPNVDRLHAELVERKAIVLMPPTNMPWGVREMHVADPDGNVLRIGTGIED